MPSLLKYILVCPVLLISLPVSADQIKLYLDNTRTKHVMVEQQDCSVHKSEDGRITLGFKIGNFLFGIGPEISFGKKIGIDWDHTVQGLIARYQELCARFNTGSITKQEYEERLAKIETVEKEAYELYQEFLKKKARRKQDVFDELDRETQKTKSIKKSYDQINKKISSYSLSK
ncbi:uncharacterized protein METZ01_LOCUS254831 [marine metagenome]|uniref:Uncharacterized protein n=1 Tax=marine metagenome TaxID=408172 RepID=A0A382IS07_9ZZZZ